jgi:uncharacterized membrane protein
MGVFALPKTLMRNQVIMQIVDGVARGLELVGVAVIAVSFVYAILRAVQHYRAGRPDIFEQLKIFIGRGLQLGLEFLVAADIISTVTVEPTREQIVSLGLLIVIRTVLSWSITVEIEGCWPWQLAKNKKG